MTAWWHACIWKSNEYMSSFMSRQVCTKTNRTDAPCLVKSAQKQVGQKFSFQASKLGSFISCIDAVEWCISFNSNLLFDASAPNWCLAKVLDSIAWRKDVCWRHDVSFCLMLSHSNSSLIQQDTAILHSIAAASRGELEIGLPPSKWWCAPATNCKCSRMLKSDLAMITEIFFTCPQSRIHRKASQKDIRRYACVGLGPRPHARHSTWLAAVCLSGAPEDCGHMGM